ncbi:MAG: ImmA/IrrE family metallo-endopeptidase [Verrucomicrobiota bacterium]
MKNDIGLGFKIRLERGFKTDAEKAAVVVRQILDIEPHGRLAAGSLAEHMGLRVVFPHEIPGMSVEDIAELKTGGSRRWSAIYLPVPSPHRDWIINNDTHSPERQEANLFHEIGHQICGHEPDEIVTINGLPFREFSQEKEKQADFLGQALHIPKDAAFWVLRNGLAHEEICGKYCASSALVKLRLNISGANKVMMRSKAKYPS